MPRADGARLEVGARIQLQRGVLFWLQNPATLIKLGNDVFTHFASKLIAYNSIVIGDGTHIAWNVTVMDDDFHTLGGRAPGGPVTIGSRVWVGAGVIITRGVKVRDGAVLGAGSVVTSDVGAGCLVAGNPAREIRRGVTWRPER